MTSQNTVWRHLSNTFQAAKNKLRFLLLPLLRPIRVPRIIRQVKEIEAANQPIRIIIGAGATHYDGWISTELPVLNILKSRDWQKIFRPHSIHRILAEHVFEHLTTQQFRQFLRIVPEYLAKDGRIRIAVPDGNHPDQAYIDHIRPGGTGPYAYDHKLIYDAETLTQLAQEEGYDYQLLEYFDANHEFHAAQWSDEDGYVVRSAKHDKRNQQRPLTYTSLIVDLWPKSP